MRDCRLDREDYRISALIINHTSLALVSIISVLNILIAAFDPTTQIWKPIYSAILLPPFLIVILILYRKNNKPRFKLTPQRLQACTSEQFFKIIFQEPRISALKIAYWYVFIGSNLGYPWATWSHEHWYPAHKKTHRGLESHCPCVLLWERGRWYHQDGLHCWPCLWANSQMKWRAWITLLKYLQPIRNNVFVDVMFLVLYTHPMKPEYNTLNINKPDLHLCLICSSPGHCRRPFFDSRGHEHQWRECPEHGKHPQWYYHYFHFPDHPHKRHHQRIRHSDNRHNCGWWNVGCKATERVMIIKWLHRVLLTFCHSWSVNCDRGFIYIVHLDSCLYVTKNKCFPTYG